VLADSLRFQKPTNAKPETVIGNGKKDDMKLKNIILSFLLLTISTIASAKKMNLPIELVATQADIIVIGEIISAKDNSYDLKVIEHIKGDNDSIITVEQFKEWTCDIRYAKVEKGQKLFLFLKKINNKLEIINGSTGEIPITNNQVTLIHEEFKHIDYESHPYTLDLSEFKVGIIKFINCFAMLRDCNSCYPDSLLQMCNDKELKIFIATNEFSKWIYKKVKGEYKIIKS
jgi:hypothetical protein